MTLRALVPMAEAAEQAEWVRTGVTISWFVAAMTGKNIDPYKIIPPQFRPPKPPAPKKSKAEIEMESRLAWGLIRKVFRLPPKKTRPPQGE